jgi:hypothetical protein
MVSERSCLAFGLDAHTEICFVYGFATCSYAMCRLMHDVGSVRVDSITMTVDRFVFFLYCVHDMPIPAGITI